MIYLGNYTSPNTRIVYVNRSKNKFSSKWNHPYKALSDPKRSGISASGVRAERGIWLRPRKPSRRAWDHVYTSARTKPEVWVFWGLRYGWGSKCNHFEENLLLMTKHIQSWFKDEPSRGEPHTPTPSQFVISASRFVLKGKLVNSCSCHQWSSGLILLLRGKHVPRWPYIQFLRPREIVIDLYPILT